MPGREELAKLEWLKSDWSSIDAMFPRSPNVYALKIFVANTIYTLWPDLMKRAAEDSFPEDGFFL